MPKFRLANMFKLAFLFDFQDC